MSSRFVAALAILACGPVSSTCADAEAPTHLTLSLQTRGSDGRPEIREETVDARHVGVVVVDPWNFHWCKTATMRVDALIPRLNRALQVVRELGMTVMLCPSDVVDKYAGWPQREFVIAMPKQPVPPLATVNCPAPPDGGGCACGAERCLVNYGWDGMHPDLHIGRDDLLPDTLQEVWTICRDRQLTHLIYMGVHTQVCLLGKPMGLRNLKAAGLQCILARDITDAHPGYNPATGFTPDGHTAEVVAHFERYLAPTINMAEELAKIGKWEKTWVVDPVRIAPWGTTMRPHLFEHEVTVTLSAPWQPNAEIRYTTDGTEPGPQSVKYKQPLRVTATTRVRVAAFEGERRVCLESEGMFCKLSAMPPQPDVHLSEQTPLRAVGPGHTYGNHIRFAGHSQPPQKDKSNEGYPLQLRGVTYAKGLGVHATNQMVFAIQPEYERFVALVGVDEHILSVANGSNLAMHPSVVFRVFIDGQEAAASPVMRITFQPWRFDVPIPPGSKIISLATMDGGNGNQEDLANWVNCGFILKQGAAR
ncbi:MAG: NPCBM/NEW2 domain-containing protein [Planctomycetota bacterium]|nr:NPCBM/NEW2 domain-containing protein [Planctomycetota bacterium]